MCNVKEIRTEDHNNCDCLTCILRQLKDAFSFEIRKILQDIKGFNKEIAVAVNETIREGI